MRALLPALLPFALFAFFGWRWWRRRALPVAILAPELLERREEPGAAAVLGLSVPDMPTPAGLTGRVLLWRGNVWHQLGAPTARGVVTFVREVAVDGRASTVEVQVLQSDLLEHDDDSVTLRGRA